MWCRTQHLGGSDSRGQPGSLNTPPPLSLVLIIPVSAGSNCLHLHCFPLCVFKLQWQLMLNKLICFPCVMVSIPSESSPVLRLLLSTANKLLSYRILELEGRGRTHISGVCDGELSASRAVASS